MAEIGDVQNEVVPSVIDSTGQFTDGFTITIKLCSRGKLYS